MKPKGRKPKTIVQDSKFLVIPFEIRNAILEMVLLNHEKGVQHQYTEENEPRPMDFQYKWSSNSSHCRGDISGARILEACQQLYYEGREVLYGRNRFTADVFGNFRKSFTTVFKAGQGAYLRKMTIPVPVWKTLWQKQHQFGCIIEFFATKLPNLTDLTLVKPIRVDFASYRSEEHQNKANQDYYDLFWTAAWITSAHPILKRAIWQTTSDAYNWSRSDNLKAMEEQQARLDLEAGPGSRPELSGHELYGRTPDDLIDLLAAEDAWVETPQRIKLLPNLPADQRPKIRTIAGCQTFPTFLPAVVCKDVVLDCLRIRREGWNAIHGQPPEVFALPDDSETSNKPHALKQLPDGTVYRDWNSTDNWLQDRFRYLGWKGQENARKLLRVVEKLKDEAERVTVPEGEPDSDPDPEAT